MRDQAVKKWTTRMRVLAALSGSDQPLASPVVPTDWTREGIAERLDIDPSVVSRHLSSLKEEGLVKYELLRVQGLRRRRKVPHLTTVGRERLSDSRLELLRTELIVEVESGRLERRILSTLNHLWPDLVITETLTLVEWLEVTSEPIPLSQGPETISSARADDRLVHWALSGAPDRQDAVERAALLLTRPLSVSAVLRWQLELLASEAQPDSWTPSPLPGVHEALTTFLLSKDWAVAPAGVSPLLDAALAMIDGSADESQSELLDAALNRGAPGEWKRVRQLP
ncbi:MAG TPA: MarR family transcriptional regulator [Candidatus Poseidoniales archaeon]|nr:MarR family transcriptional regulator [Candidatus Poseidoniales archaeon]